jgi:hypothetical protein
MGAWGKRGKRRTLIGETVEEILTLSGNSYVALSTYPRRTGRNREYRYASPAGYGRAGRAPHAGR